VEPGAAAARLAPVLRTLMGHKQSLTSAGEALVKQVDGGIQGFRAALAVLDQAMERGNHPQVLQETARVVTLCREICPERLERLKQRISIRSTMGGPKADRMAAALGGPTLKNADFWRLLARASEQARQGPLDIAMACSEWEEFRKHAIEEKWFPAFGPEVAALYLHMADLWDRIPDEEIGFVRKAFAGRFPGHQHYYAGQPPHIRKLMTEPGRDGFYYLDPDALLARACDSDPCAENFERWLRLSAGNRRHADAVAELWSEALPREIPPLLHLMLSAEKSNAFKKAFKLMERAERLDGLNPEVRRARLRLLVSLATRHLRQDKPRLAEPELCQIEELPQAQQGDRPALAAALRWVYWMLWYAPADAADARARVARLLGSDAAADFLLMTVANACKFMPAPPMPRFAAGAMAGSIGRVCALCADLGLDTAVPYTLTKPLLRELSGKNPIPDAAALTALGEAALRGNNIEVAYAVSAAGFNLERDRWAEFLFLRARALPDWEDERQSLCAAAASELARRQRNTGLLARIGAWREEDMLGFDGQAADLAMATEDVDKVVQGERRLAEYPLGRPPDKRFCNCPSCRAQRAQQEQMPPELERLVEALGPEELARMLEGIGNGLGPKRKKRRRPVFGDDEIPF